LVFSLLGRSKSKKLRADDFSDPLASEAVEGPSMVRCISPRPTKRNPDGNEQPTRLLAPLNDDKIASSFEDSFHPFQ
jgi:hypothetical protein